MTRWPTPPSELSGRTPDKERISRLLSRARNGRGAHLALVGPPGIGKTALLAHARDQADGMTVLHVEPEETPTWQTPFTGIARLLDPLLGYLDAIPPSQSAAIRSILILGDVASNAAQLASTAVCSLLEAVARQRPILVLVDNAQWLDPGSMDILSFAAHQLDMAPIAFLIATRDPSRVGHAFDPTALPPLNPDEPAALRWQRDHLEALFEAGRHKEAEAALAVLEEQAEQSLGIWTRATVAFGRGLLAGGEDAITHLDEALDLYTQAGSQFEIARVQMRLGIALRGIRRTMQSREPLMAAISTFQQLGAVPWVERAQRELALTGHRRSGDQERDWRLTAAELRVVEQVGAGKTNREIASALKIGVRTVESHVLSARAKLGAENRTQLALVFRQGIPAERLPPA